MECHPFLPQHDLLKWCRERGIVVQGFSPFGSADAPLLTDPALEKIAEDHGIRVSQVLISWQGKPRISFAEM